MVGVTQFIDHIIKYNCPKFKNFTRVNFTQHKWYPWFCDENRTILTIQSCYYVSLRSQWVLSSNLIITMIYVCARFCFAMASGMYKLQGKLWIDCHLIIMRSTHNFYHWCFFTTHFLVILSLPKALNLISISRQAIF